MHNNFRKTWKISSKTGNVKQQICCTIPLPNCLKLTIQCLKLKMQMLNAFYFYRFLKLYFNIFGA